MTRHHIPDGNSLRPLKGIIIDLGNSLDEAQSFWPADPVERAADKVLRKARARPQPREPWPWWAWLAVGAAGATLILFLASFAVDAVQTAAATAVQAEWVQPW